MAGPAELYPFNDFTLHAFSEDGAPVTYGGLLQVTAPKPAQGSKAKRKGLVLNYWTDAGRYEIEMDEACLAWFREQLDRAAPKPVALKEVPST